MLPGYNGGHRERVGTLIGDLQAFTGRGSSRVALTVVAGTETHVRQ